MLLGAATVVCEMKTETMETKLADGRRVVVWKSSPEDEAENRHGAVLAPGFGRDMRQLGAVALYLAANGFTCYRFDAIDHVGLSDGDIRHYTAAGHYASLEATTELAATEQSGKLLVVALSLAARPAFRLAGLNDHIGAVLGLVGVVNLQRTLAVALGEDFIPYAYDDLPKVVRFEQFEIDPRPLWIDIADHGWASVEGTTTDLAAFDGLVGNFIGTADDWVDLDDVRHAFAVGGAGPRRIYEMPYGEHEVNQNPVALQVLMRRLTEEAVGAFESSREDGKRGTHKIEESLSDAPIDQPSFDDIISLTLEERELAETLQKQGWDD